MKIEEAKIRFEEIETYTHGFYDDVLIKKRDAKVLLDQIQLDQQKKEVPQMIFDVIESFDENKDYLHQHMSRQPSEVREWLTHNERDFYEAWLAYPNITVEKEKLYTVEIPTNSEAKLALVRREDKKIVITIVGGRWRELDNFQLTEQEIRKDFDWAWQQGFAKEVRE